MSRTVLQFDDGETYARLMDEIRSINNVAFLIDGKVDEHLSTRLKTAGAKAHELLTHNVRVGKDYRDRLDSLFDKEGNVILEEEPRGHVNFDADAISKDIIDSCLNGVRPPVKTMTVPMDRTIKKEDW